MKILLLGNYEFDEQESMQRFSDLLAGGLSKLGASVSLLRPRPIFGRLSPGRSGLGKWLGYFDKFVIFPFALRSHLRWADLVHITDQGNSLYVNRIKTMPHLVTCHDLTAVQSALGKEKNHRTRWTGRQLQTLILRGLSATKNIAAVSFATKSDLLDTTSIQEAQIDVIYNGLNYPYSPMAEDDANRRIAVLGIDPSCPFLFHIGSNEWYKNREGIIRAFLVYSRRYPESKIKLVMAGKPWTDTMRSLVASSPDLTARIIEVGNVSNEDLRALYSRAALLLFPSLKEGFGWPIIEAQSCGCPVVTSNRAPMTEVAGEAAVFVDPEQADEIALGITAGLVKAAELRSAGFRNSTRYSADAMICKYLELYARIIARS